MAAEAVAVLIQAVDPEAERLTQRLVDVGGQPEPALAVAGQGKILEFRASAALQHAVDDSAAAAAAENHRVGALQDLDPVDIIEIAEILDVVAHPVDEEVGGAAVAAQHDRVAIALARVEARTRHEI